MTSPAVYEHYRPTDADVPDGIYRVVGASEGRVTMLRVGDETGRRVNTGVVIGVSDDELDGFERAANPDGNRAPGDRITAALGTGYWSLRAFVQQLLAHPVPTVLSVTLVLVGALGDGVVPLPELGLDALVLLGSAVLAYVGSGRL